MQEEKIREQLEELHLELMIWKPTEKLQQEKKETLAAYIRESLDQGNLEEHYVPLSVGLTESIIAFEDEHPRIKQLIDGAKSLLNSVGI